MHSSLVLTQVSCTTSSRLWVVALLLQLMSSSTPPTLRVSISQISGGAISSRTQRQCSSTTDAWYVPTPFISVVVLPCRSGHHDLHCHCSDVCVHLQPSPSRSLASTDEEAGYRGFRDGECSSPSWHLYPLVLGPHPARCYAPSWERHVANDYPSPTTLTQTSGGCRTGLETSLSECQENYRQLILSILGITRRLHNRCLTCFRRTSCTHPPHLLRNHQVF